MKKRICQLGLMSELISKMVSKGATEEELKKVLKHFVVILDADKLKLDVESSASENDIPRLLNMYLYPIT